MSAKKIATSLPACQYEALERLRKRFRLGRSEAIQQALSLWIAARQGDQRIAQYVRGYVEQPDDSREARVLAAAWSTGMEAEDW